MNLLFKTVYCNAEDKTYLGFLKAMLDKSSCILAAVGKHRAVLYAYYEVIEVKETDMTDTYTAYAYGDKLSK